MRSAGESPSLPAKTFICATCAALTGAPVFSPSTNRPQSWQYVASIERSTQESTFEYSR